ncbi:MAG TPA: methionyl-tRNA formyltransferase, partial [Patescibacteria group bacterium]|nr:methionyl-tRNA formyltransferase [Patescibacteria group bacterium]
MKIVFFGTPNIALPVLESLAKEHEIAAVVTRPDVKVGRKQQLEESPVSALGRDLGFEVLKPERVKNNPELLQRLSALAADIFVVVAYGQILPLAVINLPRLKTVNVHFSVLPRYRGPSPIQGALLSGEAQTGVSLFVLDELVDHGPLIAQEIVGIDPRDNYFTLADKLARRSAEIINSALAGYAAGAITPLPQDEAAATTTKIIAKADGKIDWSRPAAEIFN